MNTQKAVMKELGYKYSRKYGYYRKLFIKEHVITDDMLVDLSRAVKEAVKVEETVGFRTKEEMYKSICKLIHLT